MLEYLAGDCPDFLNKSYDTQEDLLMSDHSYYFYNLLHEESKSSFRMEVDDLRENFKNH
jgi:hypothetical protein